MAHVTLRVLDGADRGRIFDKIALPVTIGREEGNTIQLNDERVSRFHIKIQEDHDDFVLTDLDSTNGTRVNGEETQVRILRHGDLISVGRSTLLFGTREQINKRLDQLSLDNNGQKRKAADSESSLSELMHQQSEDQHLQLKLLMLQPPNLPSRLSPGQAAQLAEVLEYLHLHMRRLVQSSSITPEHNFVRLEMAQWQQLLDLQARVAEYLRKIGQASA